MNLFINGKELKYYPVTQDEFGRYKGQSVGFYPNHSTSRYTSGVLQRICEKCGTVKKRNGIKRIQYTCPKCASEWKQKQRDLYPEKVRAQRRRLYLKNHEKNKAVALDYYMKHREERIAYNRKWKKENPDKVRATSREWYKANPEKLRVGWALKRSRLRNGRGITADQLLQKLKDQMGLCVYCGIDIKDDYHIEHKTPLCRGGENEIENVDLTCPACNMHKHQKTKSEFVKALPKLNLIQLNVFDEAFC